MYIVTLHKPDRPQWYVVVDNFEDAKDRLPALQNFVEVRDRKESFSAEFHGVRPMARAMNSAVDDVPGDTASANHSDPIVIEEGVNFRPIRTLGSPTRQTRVREVEIYKDIIKRINESSFPKSFVNSRVIMKEIPIRNFEENQNEWKFLVQRFKYGLQKYTAEPYLLGVSETHVLIVQQKLVGFECRKLMQRTKSCQLASAALYRIADGLIKALIEFEDNDIAHGDIKPENIIALSNETSDQQCQRAQVSNDSDADDDNQFDANKEITVAVVDFESATSMRSEKFLDSTMKLCGTPQYMAPSVLDLVVTSYGEQDNEPIVVTDGRHAVSELTASRTRNNLAVDDDQAQANQIASATSARSAVQGVVRSDIANLSVLTEEPQSVSHTSVHQEISDFPVDCRTENPLVAEILEQEATVDVRQVVSTYQKRRSGLENCAAEMSRPNEYATPAVTRFNFVDDGQQNLGNQRTHSRPPRGRLHRNIDFQSASLTLHAIASGECFFKLHGNFRENIRKRHQLEKIEFTDSDTQQIKSSEFINWLDDALACEQVDGRFPKWFLKLLKCLYTSGNFPKIQEILNEGHKEVFGCERSKPQNARRVPHGLFSNSQTVLPVSSVGKTTHKLMNCCTAT